MSTTTTTQNRPSPTFTCQDYIRLYDGEFSGLCVLAEGHGGEHEYVDTMGLCGVNDHCRAARELSIWGDNGFDHNHPVHEGPAPR